MLLTIGYCHILGATGQQLLQQLSQVLLGLKISQLNVSINMNARKYLFTVKLGAHGEDFAEQSFIRAALLSKIFTVCAGLKGFHVGLATRTKITKEQEVIMGKPRIGFQSKYSTIFNIMKTVQSLWVV